MYPSGITGSAAASEDADSLVDSVGAAELEAELSAEEEDEEAEEDEDEEELASLFEPQPASTAMAMRATEGATTKRDFTEIILCLLSKSKVRDLLSLSFCNPIAYSDGPSYARPQPISPKQKRIWRVDINALCRRGEQIKIPFTWVFINFISHFIFPMKVN